MKHKFIPIFFLLLLAGAFLSSCSNKASDSTPVVRFVRPVDVKQSDKLLTSVSMGSTVAIIGENLGEVVKIAFNDQACKLNPTLITPTSIICQVPSTMPGEVTNKMYLETRGGKTVEFGIAVIIPSPSVESMDCLYAPAGSETVIRGKYFFAREDGTVDVSFPGQVSAVVKTVTETAITITVPDGANIEGPVSVTSAYGTTRSTFKWHSTDGLFEDFAGTTEWNPWGMSRFGEENPCSGQYVHLYGGVGSWAWPANEMQLMWINPEHKPLVDEGEPADYALEFEYCCAKWDCTPIILWFNKDVVEQSVDGTEAQYHWKLFEDGFTPDVWTTIRIPISDFTTNKEENEERHLGSFDDMVNFHMMPFGAADGPGELDIKIDNLRLVSIK